MLEQKPYERLRTKPYRVSCHKCGHTWTVRTGRMPVRCPACMTRNWMVAEAQQTAEA